MKKRSVLYILEGLIFLVLFNSIFFVVGGTEHSVSAWISYGFIHFAYLMRVATPFFVRKDSSSVALFRFTTESISSAYAIIELIVGIIFILIDSESFKVAFMIQVILLGIYAAVLVSTVLVNEKTADSVEKQEAEVAYIKHVSSRVNLLIGKSNRKDINRAIEGVYDLLHSSPSRSVPAVRHLEEQINNKIGVLEVAVARNEPEMIMCVTAELTALTEERNRIIKSSN